MPWTQYGEPIYLDGNRYETPFSVDLPVRADIMSLSAARVALKAWDLTPDQIEEIIGQ